MTNQWLIMVCVKECKDQTIMEKSSNSIRKDILRTAGKHFVRVPSTWDERVTASGVTYGGRYVRDKKIKRVKGNRG